MPLYDYKCLECGKVITVKHGISEKKSTCEEITDCDRSGEISKILSLRLDRQSSSEESLADKVERYIESTREEMKESTENLKERNFPDPRRNKK